MKKKIRLLICSTYIPPFVGGAEQVVWEIATRLTKYKDIEVHILTTGKEGTYFEHGLIIHKVPNIIGKEIAYTTFWKYKLDKLIKDNNFDIIHSHIGLPWGYVFRNFQGKKIITCHGSDVYPKKNLIQNYFLNKTLINTDIITTPSKWLSTYILNNYGYKSIIIPNGVDTSFFKPKHLKILPKSILFVGRYIKRKGLLNLLDAAKNLPDYNFYFVGNGPLAAKINLNNTTNLGFKTKTELVNIYSTMAVCIFPSYWENFPIVGLEAASCGKAIIATKLGFNEIIDNTSGLLINNNSKQEIITAIDLIFKNKLFNVIKKNSRSKALKFKYDKIIQKYLQKCYQIK
jgi:glycosyltransferase involved in cell wall biosynthesis